MANTPVDCHVTDHAVVRYLERCRGIDIAAVRAEILADGRGSLVTRIGQGKLRSHALGVRLVIRDSTVVSIYRIGEAAE